MPTVQKSENYIDILYKHQHVDIQYLYLHGSSGGQKIERENNIMFKTFSFLAHSN